MDKISHLEFKEDGTIYFYDMRVAICGLDWLGYIQGYLMKILGSKCYKPVKQAAKISIKPFISKYFDIEGKSVESFINFMSIRGFRVFKIKNIDKKGNATLYLEDNFLKNFFLTKGDHPGDYYLAGEIEGAWEIIFNKGFEVKETKCILKGDNICEFDIKVSKNPVLITHEKEYTKSKSKNREFKQLSIDKKQGKIKLFNIEGSAVMLRPTMIVWFLKEMEKYIGDSAFYISKIGKKTASIDWIRWSKKTNPQYRIIFLFIKMFPMIKIPVLRKLFKNKSLGFGLNKEIVCQGKNLIFSIENSFIADYYKNSGRCVCDFHSGYIEQLTETIIGGKWKCREFECTSKGDSKCRFIATQINKKEIEPSSLERIAGMDGIEFLILRELRKQKSELEKSKISTKYFKEYSEKILEFADDWGIGEVLKSVMKEWKKEHKKY